MLVMVRYHEIMKRIQIAISDSVYRKAKVVLAENGLTWQKWGETQISGIFSESIDTFGMPLMEMAVDKNQFMTKIQEKLVGAIREFAFVLLAKKNGQSQWVQHKETEIERLKLELLDVFDLETKGKWNKLRAAQQAIEYYRNRLNTFITRALNQYERYYKAAPKKIISQQDLLPLLNDILESLPTK